MEPTSSSSCSSSTSSCPTDTTNHTTISTTTIHEQHKSRHQAKHQQASPASKLVSLLQADEAFTQKTTNLPADWSHQMPITKWVKLGDVVVFKSLPNFVLDDQELCVAFGRAAATITNARVVLTFDGRIVGELRTPPPEAVKLLYSQSRPVSKQKRRSKSRDRAVIDHDRGSNDDGSIDLDANDDNDDDPSAWPDTETIHIENGIRYSFDVTRVMFAPGNGTERKQAQRYTQSIEPEVVVDMFAGIGYFSVPVAVHGRVARLISIEKNPVSCRYLARNMRLNAVDRTKTLILCGDNRVVGNEWLGKAHRVLMGYLPSAEPFLCRALAFLNHTTLIDSRHTRVSGTLHYHYVCTKAHARLMPAKHVANALDAFQRGCRGAVASDQHAPEFEATMQQHLVPESEAFSAPNDTSTASDAIDPRFRIEDVRCVKSYGPRVFHFVADITVDLVLAPNDDHGLHE